MVIKLTVMSAIINSHKIAKNIRALDKIWTYT